MTNSTPVRPASPPAAYIGGKLNLSGTIISLINATPHTCYAEGFVGMGGVFLRREFRPKSEIINDFSGDVANLFRVLQNHYVAFMDMLKWQVTSRAEFERLLALPGERLTDLQRAARFLYVQRTSFGGKVAGRNFGVTKTGPARFDVTKLGAVLEEVHSRLASVVIENLDYKAFIPRYDGPETLFYLDPPYYGCEGDYNDTGALFAREEFAHMAALLKDIKGRFILSLNDHPDVREIFKGFEIDAVAVKYTVGGGDKQGRFGEVLITNYRANPMLV